MSDGGINPTDWIFKKAKDLEAENEALKIQARDEKIAYGTLARSYNDLVKTHDAMALQIEALKAGLRRFGQEDDFCKGCGRDMSGEHDLDCELLKLLGKTEKQKCECQPNSFTKDGGKTCSVCGLSF